MTPQTLPFARAKDCDLLPALIEALDRQGWVTAKTLARLLDSNDRAIRDAASQSQGRVISGQRGYCLTHQASVQDVQHAANWLRSQGTKMIQRAYDTERAMHRRTA